MTDTHKIGKCDKVQILLIIYLNEINLLSLAYFS